MAPAVAQNQGDPSSSRYWVVPAARAFVALAVAVFVTFTRDAHTVSFGLIVFGIFAVVDGLVTSILGLLVTARSLTSRLFGVQGGIAVIAGVLALVLNSGGVGLFLYIVTVWAALTGFLELYCGLRDRRRDAAARDWFVTGTLTAILALVFLLIPADVVLAIGLFGVWAVIVGVFQGIGAASLRFAARSLAATRHAEGGS